MAEADMLCFNRAEQREISLALALRIGALTHLAAAAEISPSQRAVIRDRLSECERLARLIAAGGLPA